MGMRHHVFMAHGRWFTFTESAGESTRHLGCRVILSHLWPSLASFDLDLVGLDDDITIGDAVDDLGPYRVPKRRNHRQTDIVRLAPGRDDPALEAAMRLLTRTVGSAGFSANDGSMIYDVNDGGTSCAFRLTPTQFIDIEAALKREGAPPSLLQPLP